MSAPSAFAGGPFSRFAVISERIGLPTAIFSLKCLIAALLSWYLALRIGLERPFWAFLTSYIIAQPFAGAVISKAVFRIIGTAVGALVTVAIVPAFSNVPELMSLAFAVWLGICVFISLLDRTPRSYAFVLAGYTALLIGIPSVEHADNIFNVAILRVQEIWLGIACGTVVHGVVLPGSITRLLFSRVETMLRDAEIWSRDAIAREPVPGLATERRRLAQDVTELHQLSTHLPFDISRLAPRVRTVRALQDQLSLLLPLGAGVEDRLTALRGAGQPLAPELDALIADTRAWLEDPGEDLEQRAATTTALRARCAALEPELGPRTGWKDMLLLSLVTRLSNLITAHRDCRELYDQMIHPRRQPVSERAAELLDSYRREFHRDYSGALRGALAAAVTLFASCMLWVGSNWVDGGTAVMFGGVFMGLFAGSPNPMAPLKGFISGTVVAAALGTIYAFGILPLANNFLEACALLSPLLVVLGVLMASPRYIGLALPVLLGMGNPVLIGAAHGSDFVGYINGMLAQMIGIWFGIIGFGLLQSAGLHGAIRETVRAGWVDIASHSTLATMPDVHGWINRMLDRISLLGARLAAAGRDSGRPLYEALRDLRTGLAVGELRQLRNTLAQADARRQSAADLAESYQDSALLTQVLAGVSDYYRRLDPDAPVSAPSALLGDIDAALSAFMHNHRPEARREGMLGLVSLRRNLFPNGQPYESLPA